MVALPLRGPLGQDPLDRLQQNVERSVLRFGRRKDGRVDSLQGSVMIHILPELQVKSLMDDSAEPLEEGCAHKIEDHTGVVLDVALSDDFDDCFYMASVGNDYALNVYRIDQKYHSLFSIESAHHCVIPCVTFGHASSNSMIFTGGWDHVIKVWNLDGELVKELQGHLERITDLCVSKDGKYVREERGCRS